MLAAMNPNPKMIERINPIELNGGQGAERLCERYGITPRGDRRWALLSHQRAIAAQRRGRFARRDRARRRPRPAGRRAPLIDRRPGAARRHHATRRSRRCSRSTGADGRITAAAVVRPGRRRRRLPGHVARRGDAPRPHAAGAHPHHRHRRLRPDAISSTRPSRPRTRAFERSGLRRCATWRSSRSTRPSPARRSRSCASSGWPRTTPRDQRERRRLRARPSGRRLGRAPGRHDWRSRCAVAARATAWRRSAAAWARAPRRSWKRSEPADPSPHVAAARGVDD